jgi:hypothetical protein
MSYDETQEHQMPPKALVAFAEYKLTAPEERSLRKLADAWEKAGKGKADARRRQLERWSQKYEWVRLCEEYDRARREERYRRYEDAYDNHEEQMIAIGAGILGMTLANLKLLLEEDNRRLTDYAAAIQALRPGQSKPKQPRVSVGPYVLASLANWSAAEARQAHQARLAAHADDAAFDADEASIPPVFEVLLSAAPPPEPIDPYENVVPSLPPPGVGSGGPMIGLSGERPPDEDELDDEDALEDRDD